MTIDPSGNRTSPEDVLAAERAHVVRLCARFTGDRDAAEDLAQETLFEAWRHEHRLRDPEKRAAWLAGIARNVCLRWARRRARDAARLVRRLSDDAAPQDLDTRPADDFDLEIELERGELAALLDRALGLLPPATRAVLVGRYVEESPHAEIAARLGLTEATVAKRLERGKLALRRVLTTDLRQDAAAYGLHPAGAEDWQETRIWCPNCGQRRLTGRFHREEHTGEFILWCPSCGVDPSVNFSRATTASPKLGELLRDVKGYRPTLARVMRWADNYLRDGLATGKARCVTCNRTASVWVDVGVDALPAALHSHRIRLTCEVCGDTLTQSLSGLILTLPAGRKFWRDHQRIRTLQNREIEVGGRMAIVTSVESVTGSARLDVISVSDTFEVLAVYGAPALDSSL